MRIAYIGLKGLPATFSGIETHVRELGTRLVQRGHEVTAYVRPRYTPKHLTSDQGIRLVHLPTIHSKHLDASVHSLLSAIHTLGSRYDIVHFHTIGPGCFSFISKFSPSGVFVTIHRQDYLSGKWSWFAKSCLRAAEQISLRTPHQVIVVAPFLKAHYENLGYRVQYIPNGVSLPRISAHSSKLRDLGLFPNQYVLFLGRLVPEKRPDWVIRAFNEARLDGLRLVISGGSSATDGYVQQLRQLAQAGGRKMIFTGPVYGQLKDELLANARLFVLPSELEGLPITLLEAMSHARPALASDIPPHCDVIRDQTTGFLHDAHRYDDFVDRLLTILSASEFELSKVGQAARAMVAGDFDWENVVDRVEALYQQVLQRRN